MTRRHFFSLYYFWTTLTLETSLDILKIKILVGLILCFAWREIYIVNSPEKRKLSVVFILCLKELPRPQVLCFFIDFKLVYIM